MAASPERTTEEILAYVHMELSAAKAGGIAAIQQKRKAIIDKALSKHTISPSMAEFLMLSIELTSVIKLIKPRIHFFEHEALVNGLCAMIQAACISNDISPTAALKILDTLSEEKY